MNLLKRGKGEKLVPLLFLSRNTFLTSEFCGVCRNILGQLAEAMPQAVTVTPEEQEAIERVSSSLFFPVYE